MTPDDPRTPRSVLENVAFYILLLLGGVSLIRTRIDPAGAVAGPIYLLVAWGIRREKAWTAYGFALFTLVSTGMVLLNATNLDTSILKLAGIFTAVLVVLLLFVGLAIEKRVGRHGLAWPWLAVSALAALFLATFSLYQMPTGSMENTLLIGDHLAVRKASGSVPQRGQLVTHIYPVNRKDIFVKRVVGIPGDRIRIRDKQLYVNGGLVPEPYVIHRTDYVDAYRDNFPSEPNVPLYPGAREMLVNNVVNGEVVVPPGHYFVLGDNRDNSLDSRYWGFIAQSDIIGIPKFVYYSFGQTGPDRHVRWSRFFHSLS